MRATCSVLGGFFNKAGFSPVSLMPTKKTGDSSVTSTTLGLNHIAGVIDTGNEKVGFTVTIVPLRVVTNVILRGSSPVSMTPPKK
jgi:hypothetical protein